VNGGVAGLRCLLCTVLRYKAIDVIRRHDRRGAQNLAASLGSTNEPVSHEPSPDEDLERSFDQEFVHVMLGKLQQIVPAARYRVFYLRMIEERPVADVAELMDMTEADIRLHRHRVQKKFEMLVRLYRGDEILPAPSSGAVTRPGSSPGSFPACESLP